jgi:hypothetical protein
VRRRLVPVLLAGVLAVAGCGVPTTSGVQYVGPGPATGPESPDEGEPPPSADDATTPEAQVENFLQAAAGHPDGADDRVSAFLRSSDRERWQPEEEIRVVRLLQTFVTPDAGGGWRVRLNVQPVGTLHRLGYLDAATGGQTSYEFRVVSEGSPDGDARGESPRLRIADPPAVILLADTALTDERYYYPTPIYFWDNAEHNALVPDLRWLPQAGEPADQHPFTVLEWLREGPAPSLSRLQDLPLDTQAVGPPVWEGNRLVVNLNATVADQRDLDDLGTQLAWSLVQLRDGAELELQLDGQRQDFRPRPRTWMEAEPVRMAVLDGVIRQVSGGARASFPVLNGDVNAGVLAGALARDGRLAALVREDPAAGQRLSAVRADDRAGPVETATGLTAGQIGQPIWLRTGGAPLGLVVADGDLYRFTAAEGSADQLSVSGLAGQITAVAVAPERRRVALIADDELYVASLQLDGEAAIVLAPRALPTTPQNLAGVAFSHENRLVVAGERGGRVGLYSLTVDGGQESQLGDLGDASVVTLVAHPYDDRTDLEAIMYEADGQSFTFTGRPDPVRAGDLVEAPDDSDSTPQAPFFVD